MKLNGKALWSDSDNEEGSSSCSREDDSGSNQKASISGDEVNSNAPVDGPSSSPGHIDLSTDPRMVVNAVVRKFETEEAHYLPPLGTQDSNVGPSEPGQAPKTRKPKEKRTPSVEGGTLVTADMLFNLRLDHLISDEVEFRVPTTKERADSPPKGYFTCMYHHIKLAFLWFPIPDIIVSFLWRHNLCFSQVTVQSFRNIIALLVRCYESGHSLSVREMRHFLQCTKGKKLSNHYFAPRPGYKLITHFPTKDPVWERYYFFVKLNSASIEGPLHSVKTEWQWRVNSKPPKESEAIEALLLQLRRHSCKWTQFSFARADLARAVAVGAADFVCYEDPGLSVEELEARLTEMILARKRRVDGIREQKVEEIKRSIPDLSEDPDRAKAKGIREALAIGGTSSGSPLKESTAKSGGTKRTASELKGKSVEDPEAKRPRTSGSAKSIKTVPPFGHILPEGSSIPDYSTFAHIGSMELAWKHMTGLCMGTNQAFVSYETDLRARRAEVAELNKKLEEASNLARSEKERADQADKKAKKYRGRLNAKGKKVEGLTEELKTARQSREKIESELKEKLFDKVHERCELVKGLLVDLKKGPGDEAHLYGQTKNNLVLVRDLLSDEPPNLKDEKATLKKELREYKGAPQKYDRAFNNILRILSFENGNFPDAVVEEEELVLSEDDISSGDEDTTKGSSKVRETGEDGEAKEGGEEEKAPEAKDPEAKDHIVEDPEVVQPEVENQIVRDTEDQGEDETAEKPTGSDVGNP